MAPPAGPDSEKKTTRAAEQDRPDVQQKRRAFLEQAKAWEGRRVIYIDEFGTNLGQTRRYAYSQQGDRALGAVPENTDPNLTLVMGLRRTAVVAPFVFMGAMDGDAFTQYIREQLGPELLAGDVVVVDGLGAHRSLAAQKAIEEFGAELVSLPPYSPDLTPVEECGSKVKAYVRGREPRTVEQVHEVMAEALRSVTSLDTLGWFRDRAAYLIPPLPK